MGAWATAQDIDDNDKRFSERYVARQDSKVTMQSLCLARHSVWG